MTKKSKIYTKTGDLGTTSLLGGTRVFKHHLRISLYGEIDELNAHLGFLITLLDEAKFLNEVDFLKSLQHKLFSLGSFFSCETLEAAKKFNIKGLSQEDIVGLEKKIDEMDNELIPLKNFILPGGDNSATYAHICRTICRRVERSLTHLYEEESVRDTTHGEQLIFINRLSDFFFVLSRWINFKLGSGEVLWINK